MFFAITNNTLTSNIKSIILKMSPRATIAIWNNSKDVKDGSFGMKHFKNHPRKPTQKQMGNSG
jgi:hypothetical protein